MLKFLVTSFVWFLAATCLAQDKPNIIYILTDDLGYGDLGVYFQNERKTQRLPFLLTPNLDRMAADGAVMEQYCAAPVCAPSRASLLLGVSQGHANVRDNQFDKALEDNYTLGSVMQKVGYRTIAIGKWGLQGNKTIGPDWPAGPQKRGFDHYFGYISHGDGKEHYPKEGLYRGAKKVWDDSREISSLLDLCYTGDLFTAFAKKHIIDHIKSEKGGQPFFMYLAYDTPHAVLELPGTAYPKGGGVTGGVQWLGKAGKMINTAVGKPDTWVHPDYVEATYDHDNNAATSEVAWPDTYKRYATVVRRIDDQIGDLLQLLRDLNIDQNTLVIFSSDNGPSAESNLPKSFATFTPNFFGSYGPFDGIKRDVLEGGVRVPTIAYWPSKIHKGIKVAQPSMSYDWMPTFTAASGVPAPVRSDGVSLLPVLTGLDTQPESLIYVEYFNNSSKTPGYQNFEPIRRGRVRNQMQMIRFGDTVGIRYDIQSHKDNFEIFDVVNDPKQANNLNGMNTKALQERMKAKVLQVRRINAEAPRPYDGEMIPPLRQTDFKFGLGWKSFEGTYPWLIKTDDLSPSKSGVLTSMDVSKIKSSDSQYLLQGFLNIPEDDSYVFYFKTAGSGFVRLHDIALIDADFGYKPMEEIRCEIRLKKGLHPIRIYYSPSNPLKPNLDLKWESSRLQKQAIPMANFLR